MQEEDEQISLNTSTNSTSSAYSASPSTCNLAKKTTQTKLIYDVKNAKDSTMKPFIDKLESGEQESIDKLLARATYSSCTPLNWTENKYWKNAFHKIRPALKLPSRYRLSNSLLNEEYHRVQARVHEKINEADSLTLMSDGWTDIKGNPLLNFVFATPEPVFLKAIETKTKSHTAQYMAEVIGEVIDTVGSEKVHGLVTDNAANMKCAWTILKEKYPHLITFGCLGHGLNLLAKDICKLNTVHTTVQSVKQIIHFFKDKHTPSQVLKQIQQEREGKETSLLYPVETRWGSVTKCLESALKCKEHLQAASVDPLVRALIPTPVRKHVLDDDVFWTKVSGIVKLLKPVTDAITKLETDSPILCEVTSTLKTIESLLEETVHQSPLNLQEEIDLMTIFKQRKEFCFHPVQHSACMLDPKQKGSMLTEEETSVAVQTISDIAETMTDVDTGEVLGNLAEYRAGHKAWSSKAIWNAANNTSPVTWWKGFYGNSSLAKVAIRLLSMPATSAACERNFKSFSNIKTKKRNKLTSERTAKLVTIHYNLHLLEEDELETKKEGHHLPQSPSMRIHEDSAPEPEETDIDNMSDVSVTTSGCSGSDTDTDTDGQQVDDSDSS